ncbi:hypothetical protein B296_00000997 [Ensete ventricosum]|uniref:Uncharacterized protein n=1 Tax=Ensete ventricosum TaxID=4639 RepID=A0A427B9M4_ENSVE|nr:hypothetical protein B296_00000997 [Ensete ventricosum]
MKDSSVASNNITSASTFTPAYTSPLPHPPRRPSTAATCSLSWHARATIATPYPSYTANYPYPPAEKPAASVIVSSMSVHLPVSDTDPCDRVFPGASVRGGRWGDDRGGTVGFSLREGPLGGIRVLGAGAAADRVVVVVGSGPSDSDSDYDCAAHPIVVVGAAGRYAWGGSCAEA